MVQFNIKTIQMDNLTMVYITLIKSINLTQAQYEKKKSCDIIFHNFFYIAIF